MIKYQLFDDGDIYLAFSFAKMHFTVLTILHILTYLIFCAQFVILPDSERLIVSFSAIPRRGKQRRRASDVCATTARAG